MRLHHTTRFLSLITVFLLTFTHVSAVGYCNSVKTYTKLNSAYTFNFKIPAVGGSTNCIMNEGAASSAVTSLQTALTRCSGAGGSVGLRVDGEYGPITKRAVRVYQDAVGLTVDGVYGPKTGAALNWRGSRSGSSNGWCTKINAW